MLAINTATIIMISSKYVSAELRHYLCILFGVCFIGV